MNEATLRDFFLERATIGELAADLIGTVEQRSGDVRLVHIRDLPSHEEFTITAPMMVRLCDVVLAGELQPAALETIAFAVVASDHLQWAEDDELVARLLYAWASPEINWELTPESVRMFRQWITGDVQSPPEPELTHDFSEGRLLRRTEKISIQQEETGDLRDEA